MSIRDEKGRRLVTVDTGGPDDLFIGAHVIWMHVPSGGYGFAMPIEATVQRVTRARVTIRLQTNAGTTITRSVMPDRLRWSS
jgi:hypothetical protein